MAVNIGSAVAYLELDTSKFSKGFKSAYNDLKVFGDKSATAEQKVKGLSSAFKTTGSILTKNVTVPLVGVGAMAVKVASDFESGMSEVQAISGATGKQLNDLKDKAIEMGAKTKFSATESADAFKYMAMAGWDTEAMLAGIEGVMNLASASGEDLATTSDIVTDALTAFGMKADETQRFVDVLARASSRSNTNVAMMGETFKYVAPVAGSLGYSVEDTAVAIGLMANSGIKGSQAGTALRSMFTRLVKPVGEAKEAVEELGINITNTDGTMKPLSQTMEELRTIFDGLTESEKAQYASMLAGQEGMSRLLAIVNASEEDFKKLTEEINNSTGATKEMSDIMMNNTAGAITLLKSALESAGIIIGEQLTPYIRQLAEWITGLVERFNSLSEEQQEQVTKWGLILASIGPILLIVSKLLPLFMSLFNIFQMLISPLATLITSVNQFGWGLTMLGAKEGVITFFTSFINVLKTILGAINPVIAIIGVLIATIVTLWNTNEEFRNKVIEIWNNLKTSIGDFVSGIKQILDDLGLNFEEIKKAILFTWKSLCNSLSPLITGAMDIVVRVIDGALDTILGVFKVFAKLFKGDWRGALNAVEDIIDGWIDTILGVFSSMFDTIGGFFRKILSGVDEVIRKGNQAKGITRGGIYADGSHANGLDYVPYNGYIAELHEGERVLTKQENKEYNKGNGEHNGSGDTYVFYNTKPNPYEYARQMKKAKKELLYGV